MKTANRFLALGLAGLVVLGTLAACGGGGSAPSGGSDNGGGDNGGSADAAAEGATYSWQVGNVLAADQPWDMGLHRFADLLDEYSGGRIALTVQSGGSLGSEIEMLEGVQMGTLDMSIASTPSMSGFDDSLNYFDLPYLFKSKSSAWSVMDEWLAKDRCDALQGSGFKGLGFYENGTYMIGSNKKLEHPEDAAGLRIRAHSSQLQCDSLAAIGANPLSVAWGDIYTSLQQGTIDGISGTTLTNMYGGKFYEQTKYITMTAHHFIPAPVVMNEDLWDSLSPEDQEIVQRAFDESVTYQREEAFRYADDAKGTIEESGVEVIDVDADEWSEAMSSVYGEWVGANGIEQDMIEKIRDSESQYL
ncbi:MAG: TRAP transporter substrate-binding protein [Clostridiales Family XIII bacterium]|jgi:tripartite ATP-independent transporter DctP family solute receptor|nr:TRAP transporter substrate-binding protein [Clostridiales Family XIII bacterium]